MSKQPIYKITITGEATTSYPFLQELDGIGDDQDFSEYIDSDKSYSQVVREGYMNFIFQEGKLLTRTQYYSLRELTPEELKDLGEYTQGQWSDGIGEGFEQNPCYTARIPYYQYPEDETPTTEVYISPWRPYQVLTITQTPV